MKTFAMIFLFLFIVTFCGLIGIVGMEIFEIINK